tara:strand:+ start:44515 stop:45900 length:1386 start_codon:yes stop_codon:yes gene_type:complete
MKKSAFSIVVLISFFFLIPTGTVRAQELDPQLLHLIEQAKIKSSVIKINNLTANQARLDRKIAKSTFIPNISLNGSYTRLNEDIEFDENLQTLLHGTEKLLIKEAIGIPFNTPLPASIPTTEIEPLLDKDVLKSSVDMEWVLFSGFKVSNAVKATSHKQKALNYANDIEGNNIIINLADTYDKLGLVLASEKVIQSSEVYLNEQEKFVNAAIKNGLATPIDKQRIILARHKLASKRIEIENNKELLFALLQKLTDEDLNHLRALSPNLNPLQVDLNLEDSKRSELLALDEAIKASKYLEKYEKNSYIPTIAAKGKYEILKDDLSLLDPQWYVGVGFKWSIFDGGAALQKAKKASVNTRKYEAQLHEAKDLIQLGETKALLEYQTEHKKVEMAIQEVELTKQVYNLVSKQYQNGLATIAEYLDSLNDLEASQFSLQQAYYNQRRAGINLLQAKGLLQNLVNN